MSERELTRVRASRVSTMLQGATRNLLPYATARQNLALPPVGRAATRDRTLDDTDLLRRVGLERPGGPGRRDACRAASGSGSRWPARSPVVAAAAARRRADQPAQPRGPRPHARADPRARRRASAPRSSWSPTSPRSPATFPRTITMRGGRVGTEGRDGAEYVVVGRRGRRPPAGPHRARLAAGHLGAHRARGRRHACC